MRRVVLAITTALTVVAASLLVTPGALAQAPPQEQWRGYWVDSFRSSIYTPQNVDKLVADAQAINANALIVQVGRWMDCFCNRSAFPRTHVAIAPDFDPLDDVIAKAHAVGIEVHAWVNATPMWNLATPPPNPDHVFHRHGHDATGADRWVNRRYDGAEVGGANLRNLDPANPAAVDYVVDGIASIVREYDVDGINLDYIRYPDYNSANYQSDWGYTETSLARFRAATGRDDVPEPTDAQFSQWRRDQVTGMLRKIYLRMHQEDPLARLSVNAITYWYGPQTEGGWEATRAYSEVMQDWKSWLAEGVIDTNVAMNYKREAVPEQAQMFDEWTEVLADWQAGRQSVVGPALYLNTVENSVAQARRALAPTAAGNRAAGWNGYSYATPSNAGADLDAERARLADALTRNDPTGAPPLFAEPAAVPSMPWKERPAKGHVAGELLLRDGTPLDQAAVTLRDLRSGQVVATRLSDGSGWFGFVDVEPGKWLVSATSSDGAQAHAMVRVTAGQVATARFAPRDAGR
ncbi:MAG: family 10 glycosylhydrolase [Micromonosporaceae bacterium]|nr:family 10 glycosylhydrolase [Micromonosporaceae bacterium]